MANHDYGTLSDSLRRGIDAASDVLCALSRGRVSITASVVIRTDPAGVVAEVGDAGRIVVGVYVGFSGAASGHALLLMAPDAAARIAGHLLSEAAAGDGEGPGTNVPDRETQELLARSALEELGNILVSSVLNELGRGLDEPIHPSVPQAVTEMAGAILESVLVDLVDDRHEVTVARSRFEEAGDAFDGWLLILPRDGALVGAGPAL